MRGISKILRFLSDRIKRKKKKCFLETLSLIYRNDEYKTETFEGIGDSVCVHFTAKYLNRSDTGFCFNH